MTDDQHGDRTRNGGPAGSGARYDGGGRYDADGRYDDSARYDADGRHDDHVRPDVTAVEEELRVLLRRAAPELPTPADRLERVLERADRTRRRRRTAALVGGLACGLTAAVLAAAPAIAPGPGRTGAAIAPAAAPVTTSPAPSATPEPTDSPAPGSRPIAFPDLGGVVLDLPDGWYALATSESTGSGARTPIGQLADEPLTPRYLCPSDQQATCPPLILLPDGGALLTLGLDYDTGAPAVTGRPATMTEQPLDKVCRIRGGTHTFVGERGGLTKGDVRLEACLNNPSSRTLDLVQRILDSLRADDPRDVEPEPAPRSTSR